MSPLFGSDPWWIVLIKVVGVFVLLLTWTIFEVWFERRVLGKMQNRKGPIMNGPFGLGQAMGDGVKLLLKEDFRPARTDALVFNLAPMLTAVAALRRTSSWRTCRSACWCCWRSPRWASTASCSRAGRPTRRTRCSAAFAPRPR